MRGLTPGVGAVLLVVATAGALALAPPASEAGVEAATPLEPWTAEDIPGFRPELFALPDDALGGFSLVPGGLFLMGSDPARDPAPFAEERWSRSELQGRVELPDFYIGTFEVTVAQFVDFVRRTGHPIPRGTDVGTHPLHPVTQVTWADAQQYVHWLDGVLRDSPATPSGLRDLLDAGWRVVLPDEAHWEKAARGSDGRLFPWGDDFSPSFANVGSGEIAPVGRAPCPCAHGLHDMAGNVWEWTASPHQPYPHTAEDDVGTVVDDAVWVMRGGSFMDGPQQVRAAHRGGADPGVRRPFIGFRIALVHAGPPR
ncbi:MAG: SUMF1/EgtB/PvdO family nonheme iron enzyme [Gemmatimonadota bacterium]